MISAHEIPEPIQWHEGMLLAPQHFQQSALRQEELLHYHTLAIAPFYWGVRRLKFDQVALVSGILRVSELEAVMPDGLVVSHGLQEGGELEVDLTSYAEEMRQRAVTIHLAVPAKKLGATPAKGDLARYDSADGHPVVDENTGEGDLRIPRLRPRLGLLVTETPPQKYVSFPLARVQNKNETFALTDFIPPTIAVPLQSDIGEMCSLIARRLREKAVFLSDQVRAPSAAMGAPLVLETKNLIQSMVAALPQFEAVLYTGVSHPYVLYLALCSLVGHLAALGTSLVPPVLAPYNHNDLRFAFEQAKEFAFRVLEEGIHEAYTTFPFTFDNGIFSLLFEGAWMTSHLVLGVRGQAGMTERDVMAWMEECLIGSRGHVQSLREKRILGAARQRIEGDQDLVPARGVLLFSLRADPEFIEPNEVLQILNTADRQGALRPAEIVLYVKNAA